MTLEGRVVIVTGPPGYIRTGFIPPHLPASQHQNLTLSRALAAAAFRFAGAGYLVARDWVVGPGFSRAYRTKAQA